MDRLLASPAHGERWGRLWLDLVRFADSGGYETDILYDQAWRYRDYVIQSLNEQTPFDQFLMEQVAGDELWPERDEAMQDAVAVWTLGEWQNALDAFPDELEYVRRTDQVVTFSEAMLGITIGCANCHNHKYDPITQRDYFGLEAVFAASETLDRNTNRKEWIRGQRNSYRVLKHAPSPVPIHLLTRGDLKKPRGLVSALVPAFLSNGVHPPEGRSENLQRRSYLARWLVSKDNPLPARAIVNRLWQWHFGQALSATPNDLGLQGSPPSHPELLDWLAAELIESGWNLKHIHRLIVLSATYKQEASRKPHAISLDPQNQWIAGFPVRRLQGEAIWDHLQAAAGTLDRSMKGPPFAPRLSQEELQGMYDIEDRKDLKWPVTPREHRRAIYILNRRSFRFPFLDAFDPPTNSTSCPVRPSTMVPTQALTLMNNQRISELAAQMAQRLKREAGETLEEYITLAWSLAYSRNPDDNEIKQALRFLETSEAEHTTQGTIDPKGAALTEFCHALMNSSEFITTY